MSDELPAGWAMPAIQDVCSAVSKRGPSTDQPTFQYIDLGAIDNRSKAIAEASELQVKDAPSRAKQIVNKGDVVFSNVRVYLENIAIVPDELDGEVASTAFCVLRPKAGIESRYLYYYVSSKPFIQSVTDLQRGNSPPSVQDGDVKSQRIPLAPTPEQKRIVSKIDELFSRIDEGARALRQVSTLVERYRQSVLKAAVTGELTRDWREARKAGGEPVESGEALLTRILTARREAWEQAELAKMKAKGVKPANDNWKKKYKEPAPSDTSDLPELPEDWVWTSLGQLFQISIGSTPSRKEPSYWSGGIPWVSSGEVSFCRINSTRETISKLGYEKSSVRLHPKGTVMLAMIGEGRTRGQAAILDIDACHNQNAASIGVPATPIPPEYIYNLLRFRYESVRGIGQGGNQPALNSELVKGIVVPLPPLEEILEICEILERHLSASDVFFVDISLQRRLVGACQEFCV